MSQTTSAVRVWNSGPVVPGNISLNIVIYVDSIAESLLFFAHTKLPELSRPPSTRGPPGKQVALVGYQGR